MPKVSVLTIDLTRRLPDINKRVQLPREYDDYGRFAILNDGTYWNASLDSIHPQNTRDGFYWAMDGGTLFLSPRGSAMNWPAIINDHLVLWLLRRLGLDSYYGSYRLNRDSTIE
jgi:hypothetical protein